MDGNSIITVFYLLPLVICTFFTARNTKRLLDEGYRLRPTGIYKAFLVGVMPVFNVFTAAYYLAVGIIDVIWKISKLLNNNENNR